MTDPFAPKFYSLIQNNIGDRVIFIMYEQLFNGDVDTQNG